MAEFKFLQNPITKKWVILAPRRAKRPDVAKGAEPVCPFCLGREKEGKEVYRVGGRPGDSKWLIRVIPNKFPFAPIHEIVIHSSDHHKNFDQLSLRENELIIRTYRQRFLTHQKKGEVIIFHNRGEGGGESLPHPHTQIAVIPRTVKMDIPRLSPMADSNSAPHPISLSANFKELNGLHSKHLAHKSTFQTPHFYLFCPITSQWPDEVWVAPKKRGRSFGEITDLEISDFAYTLSRLIQIFDVRHGHEFPYNFYIYPGGDWYLRLIPRLKVLGGFELTSGIYVNTQDPDKTMSFIKEHFGRPNWQKILKKHRAEYERRV